MATVVFSCARSGAVKYIHADEAAPYAAALGTPSIARASHVEPTPSSEWTADMAPVDGPVLGPFPTRSAALQAETAWLLTHHLGAPAPAGETPCPSR